MKILIGCSSTIDVGSGILSYCKSLTVKYKEMGHTVSLVYSESKDNSWIDKNNIDSYSVNPDGNSKSEADNLFEYVNSFQPDIIINNDNLYLQVIAPKIKVPFIFVLHLGAYSILALAKLNMDYVDKYIATTSDMKFDLVSVGIKPQNITVVLNGLNNPLITSLPNKLDEKLNIIFAGEPTRRKGVDKFIRLVKENRFENCIFHWTGGHSAMKFTNELNKKNDVRIYERLDKSDFYDLMNSCDIFLMPSRDEGLPIALLEAMGFGLLPIVSNARGGMKEVVLHGRTGFVCNIKDWTEETTIILKDINIESILNMKKEVLKYSNENNLTGKYAESLIDIASKNQFKKEYQDSIEYYKWHRPLSDNKGFIRRVINKFKVKFGIITKSTSII